jgi:hypothetical protein
MEGFGQPQSFYRPVDVPLPMNGSALQTGPFTIWHPGHYRVSLQLKRRHPHREMECLADVGMPFKTSSATGRRTDCPPSGFPPTMIEWTLLDHGKRPSQNDAGGHAGEYSREFVGRTLGWCDLRRFHTYRFTARILNPNPNLALTEPRVLVDYDEAAGAIVSQLFFSLIGIGLGLIGLIGLVRLGWADARRRLLAARFRRS